MDQETFESLKVGDRVRVLASGKIYQVINLELRTPRPVPEFRQWREDRQALYGPSFVRLKPARVEADPTRRIRQAAIDLRLMARLYVEAQHTDTDGTEIEDAFEKLSKAAIEYALANGVGK